MKLNTRYIIAYTPSYAVKPFKIVWDESKLKNNTKAKNVLKAARKWKNKKAEDPETRVFWVKSGISNDQILEFLNGTAEIVITEEDF